MQNIDVKQTGEKLVITVDLSKVADKPAEGKKMRQVANSGGFTALDTVTVDGQPLRLNLYAGIYPPR